MHTYHLIDERNPHCEGPPRYSIMEDDNSVTPWFNDIVELNKYITNCSIRQLSKTKGIIIHSLQTNNIIEFMGDVTRVKPELFI